MSTPSKNVQILSLNDGALVSAVRFEDGHARLTIRDSGLNITVLFTGAQAAKVMADLAEPVESAWPLRVAAGVEPPSLPVPEECDPVQDDELDVGVVTADANGVPTVAGLAAMFGAVDEARARRSGGGGG